jgi:hypothetical protein
LLIPQDDYAELVANDNLDTQVWSATLSGEVRASMNKRRAPSEASFYLRVPMWPELSSDESASSNESERAVDRDRLAAWMDGVSLNQ